MCAHINKSSYGVHTLIWFGIVVWYVSVLLLVVCVVLLCGCVFTMYMYIQPMVLCVVVGVYVCGMVFICVGVYRMCAIVSVFEWHVQSL